MICANKRYVTIRNTVAKIANFRINSQKPDRRNIKESISLAKQHCIVLSKISISKLTIAITTLVMTIVASNLKWGGDNWKGIIGSDGKGYYAYLPAVFIYDDLNFGFFDKIEKEKYYDGNTYFEYRIGAGDYIINKYYCGTAVAQTPFFLTAHGLSHVFGYDVDGYSKLYAIFVSISALFYLFIGLLYLNSTLKTYEIKDKHRALVVAVTVFGTNLFYYTTVEPSVSHIYSFGFISMFVYYSRQYFLGLKGKYVVVLFLFLGLIVLIRPVNGLIVFAIPFLAGDFKTLKQGVFRAFQNWKFLLIGILGFAAILSVQFIIYKVSADQWMVYSYGKERFNFLEPHFLDVLFSYRKGLFLYTPVYLVALAGLYFLWKKARFAFYTWIAFFVLITYIFSSWWMWYYGGSFSSRVYVEFLPLFMILLALALKGIRKKVVSRSFITVLCLLTIICQIQTYQYRYYQIHWSEMNSKKYWDNFLRIDKLI